MRARRDSREGGREDDWKACTGGLVRWMTSVDTRHHWVWLDPCVVGRALLRCAGTASAGTPTTPRPTLPAVQALEEEEAAYLQAAALAAQEQEAQERAEQQQQQPFGGPMPMPGGATGGGGSSPGAGTASGSGAVLCPVCGGAALVAVSGVIACPAERWQLDCRQEGLGLGHLRQRLAAAFEVGAWPWSRAVVHACGGRRYCGLRQGAVRSGGVRGSGMSRRGPRTAARGFAVPVHTVAPMATPRRSTTPAAAAAPCASGWRAAACAEAEAEADAVVGVAPAHPRCRRGRRAWAGALKTWTQSAVEGLGADLGVEPRAAVTCWLR